MRFASTAQCYFKYVLQFLRLCRFFSALNCRGFFVFWLTSGIGDVYGAGMYYKERKELFVRVALTLERSRAWDRLKLNKKLKGFFTNWDDIKRLGYDYFCTGPDYRGYKLKALESALILALDENNKILSRDCPDWM